MLKIRQCFWFFFCFIIHSQSKILLSQLPFQLVMVLIKHVINFWPSNLIWKTTALPWSPLHCLVYWLTPVGFSSFMFVTCFPLIFMLLCVWSFTTFFNCTPLCNFAITLIFVMMKNTGYLYLYEWNYRTGIQLDIYQPSQITWLIWIYVQYVTKNLTNAHIHWNAICVSILFTKIVHY